MLPVTIYTTNSCGYCRAAKRLLDGKGVAYQEVDLSSDDEGRAQLVARAGGQRTVPQIFVGDHHVGGFTDLAALDQKGELDRLLAG